MTQQQPKRELTGLCRNLHLRSAHSYWDRSGVLRCRLCIKYAQAVSRSGHDPSAGQVMAKLDHAIELETAPPWVRHPQPWT